MTTDSTTATTKKRRKAAALPFTPLWEAAVDRAKLNPMAMVGFTSVMFSEMTGFNKRAIKRWRDMDSIPWISADEAATKLGLHPMHIWGVDWLDVKGDYEQIASGSRDASIEQFLAEGAAWREENPTGKVAAASA